jgi:hypothetical protein
VFPSHDPVYISDGTIVRIDKPTLMAKTSNVSRGVVANDWCKTVAFIDVQDEILFWTVVSTDMGYTGQVIDYGVFPEHGRPIRKSQTRMVRSLSKLYYNANRDPLKQPLVRETLNPDEGTRRKAKQANLEEKIYCALSHCVPWLFSREYTRLDENSSPVTIDRIGIDAQWGQVSDLIKRFIRDQKNPKLTAYHGHGVKATAQQYEHYAGKPTWRFESHEDPAKTQIHHQLKECKYIIKPGNDNNYFMLADSNRLKSFLMKRLAAPAGTPGSISLYQLRHGQTHEWFASHVCESEYAEIVASKGIIKEEWEVNPGNYDNDFLDCMAGCMALLSYEGCAVQERPMKKVTGSLSDAYKGKR